jgi:hypothetical protein
VFIVYAVPIGLIAGYLLGGRIERLADFRFRWLPLAFGGLAVQLVLFWEPVAEAVGDAGPVIYVASTAAVLLAVLRNIRLPGLRLIALGAGLNLLAIVANGGYIPADAEALASVGGDAAAGYSNSIVTANPVLGPLTDIFALPSWMPLANVFSIGDVLIGIGVAVAIAAGTGARPRWSSSRATARP